MKVVNYLLTKNQYNDETHPKRIIVLHHTAGGTAKSSINWWQQTREKVGTCVVIDRDGTIYKAFPYEKWASGLGIPSKVFNKFGISNINTRLDQISIQIELSSWGGLTKKGDKFYNYVDKEIDSCNVTTYAKPYRGFSYYESYTTEQIKALKEFIKEMKRLHPDIKLEYNTEMWEVSRKALVGTWGIWSHTSYREDKTDCHPQPELIKMLKELK